MRFVLYSLLSQRLYNNLSLLLPIQKKKSILKVLDHTVNLVSGDMDGTETPGCTSDVLFCTTQDGLRGEWYQVGPGIVENMNNSV